MNRFLETSVIFILPFLFACNVPAEQKKQFKTPEQYNDFLIDRHSKLINRINTFIGCLGRNNDSARILLKQAENYTELIIIETSELPAFRNDTSFRVAAIENFKFYKSKISNDYATILGLYEDGNVETEEDYYSNIDPIFKSMAREEEPYHKGFYNSQKDFAEKFKMQFSKGKPNDE